MASCFFKLVFKIPSYGLYFENGFMISLFLNHKRDCWAFIILHAEIFRANFETLESTLLVDLAILYIMFLDKYYRRFHLTLSMLPLGDEMPLSRPSYLTVCCVQFTWQIHGLCYLSLMLFDNSHYLSLQINETQDNILMSLVATCAHRCRLILLRWVLSCITLYSNLFYVCADIELSQFNYFHYEVRIS